MPSSAPATSATPRRAPGGRSRGAKSKLRLEADPCPAPAAGPARIGQAQLAPRPLGLDLAVLVGCADIDRADLTLDPGAVDPAAVRLAADDRGARGRVERSRGLLSPSIELAGDREQRGVAEVDAQPGALA